VFDTDARLNQLVIADHTGEIVETYDQRHLREPRHG
jgi:predicted amidohydrolase